MTLKNGVVAIPSWLNRCNLFYRLSRMTEDQSDLLSKISEDIAALRHLKEMELRDLIVSEVERVASTPARKKMWFLSDGTLGTGDIAGKLGVNVRSVQRFLQDATKAG